MKKLYAACLVFVSLLVGVIGCESTNVTLDVPPINDYYSFQVGTSQLYKLDSTVLAPFGTSLITRTYQAKDSVESTFTDNRGRLSYRIFRYIRDFAGTQPWRFAATYVATPTANSVEYVDNNLRFIKLVSPIRNNYTFKGNAFIQTGQDGPLGYLYDWDYEYQNVGEPYTIGNKTYENTVTVLQHDETSPDIPWDPSLTIHIRNVSVEVYAEGAGLIYKELLYWNWQRNTSTGSARYEDGSYGIKLTLLNP